MNGFTIFALVALAIATVSAQDYQDYDAPAPRRPAPHRIQPGVSGPAVAKPTPVPILKQINRHNEDGSYTYGYEGADGSFKIETKANTGEVKGKYGYVDADGKLRVVEYGANKYGFQPSGEGITVAPPTLVDESTRKTGLQSSSAVEYDDGAYYAPEPVAPARAVQIRPQQQYAPRPRPAAPRPKPSFQDFTVPQESPIPQRAQIPGAAPSGVVYAEQPRPARPAQSYAPIQFAPAPAPQPTRAYSAPAPVQQPRVYSAPAPAPQRFAPSHFASASPAPQREAVPIFEPAQQVHQQLDDFGFSQPQTRPAPRPAPQPVHYAPRPAAPSRQSQGNGGILDQLAKDYALPDGGAPALHDISFGYY